MSSTQINFLVPSDTPPGVVTITIDDGSSTLPESADATVVNDISPSFFVMAGIPAATAVQVSPGGSVAPVPVFNCPSSGACALAPIDLTHGAVYLTLYGTGFQGAQALPQFANQPVAACQVGGMQATVQFVGAQPTVPGLDQINIVLPSSLPHGQAMVQCGFLEQIGPVRPNLLDTNNRWQANPIQILIQ